MLRFWKLGIHPRLENDHDKLGMYFRYDTVQALIIRAETEAIARNFAYITSLVRSVTSDNAHAWLDETLTTCEDITDSQVIGVVLVDFLEG